MRNKSINFLHMIIFYLFFSILLENFENEQDMTVIFDEIKRQKPGFFLYFTHTYPKSSVNYNFYNVK